MLINKKELQNARVEQLKNNNSLIEFQNATGFKVDIDTLTGIKAKVTSQKFYEVKPSDYMPVVVGDQPFTDQILTYKDYSIGGGFEDGIIEPGSNDSRLEVADTQIEGILVPVKYWGKKTAYNLVELAQASRSGNWSLIESKERSRAKSWQLGIQQVAFLGLTSNTGVKGLLTQADVTANTTIITKNISSMSASEFNSFVQTVLSAYFSNSNSTVLPDTFVIPTDDYLGLVAPVSETYPINSKLEYLQKAFAAATQNPNFKIMPLAYAQKERNLSVLGSGSGLNRYTLYRANDEESLRMDIPVDYTTTIQDTIDGFNYYSVAYGGFTGCKAYRPNEVLYFDHSN